MRWLEDESIKKIGYIFTALFIWYGLAWFLFPFFVQKLGALNSGTDISSLSTTSYIIGGLSIVVGVSILAWTHISAKR
ncbi:MAG: hypothetical protein KGY76_03840 [Candidatus Thermoplasmatota archaeon]|nr:hypothetical protein [Candidatus Thermoplasmatota archaeon]